MAKNTALAVVPDADAGATVAPPVEMVTMAYPADSALASTTKDGKVSHSTLVSALPLRTVLHLLRVGFATYLGEASQAAGVKPKRQDEVKDAEGNITTAAETDEAYAARVAPHLEAVIRARADGLAELLAGDLDRKRTLRGPQVPLLAQLIAQITRADLVSFSNGLKTRDSTPKMVFSLDAPASKGYKELAEKWLAKYGDVITAEAAALVAKGAEGEKPSAVGSSAAAASDI